MLTKADDFPVHQLPEPIATSGTDRNFYDRYFFNGYTMDGHLFFAVALGVYPHLNVMDAAITVIVDGVQHNLRGSRLLRSERMDTQVGPIAITVLEPLERLKVTVSDNPHGIKAELVFKARAKPVEEPRFTFRQGPRTLLDYTRLTQNGGYDGYIEVRGKRIEIESSMVVGTRDRSWGVRPIGLSDPQPLAPARAPQFYWLWSPLNFPDLFMLYHNNADETGKPWNTASVVGALGDAEPTHMASCTARVEYKSGTRHAKRCVIETVDPKGGAWRAELTPLYNFYMSGIGYGHPEWGHGQYKGDLAVGYDSFETASVDEKIPLYWHVQAISAARLYGPNGIERVGAGVLEQLVVGAHAPSGFTGLMDFAP
ncbi:MAG TPA: hypothetical protein VKB71_13385 [Rhizomicrobium sp.]|nr:hypothetical protein [Rhizomicrobium sp.]